MNSKKKTNPAIWQQAFHSQAAKLHPERTQAGGVKARGASEARRMEVYRAIKPLYLDTHALCENCGVNPSTELHHVCGRAGLWLFDVRRWKALCSECHGWVHANPAEAVKLGLLAEKGKWQE